MYLGDFQEKRYSTVPGSTAVPWTLQSTKLNPLASPLNPRVVGSRVTIDLTTTQIHEGPAHLALEVGVLWHIVHVIVVT